MIIVSRDHLHDEVCTEPMTCSPSEPFGDNAPLSSNLLRTSIFLAA